MKLKLWYLKWRICRVEMKIAHFSTMANLWKNKVGADGLQPTHITEGVIECLAKVETLKVKLEYLKNLEWNLCNE